MKDNNKILKIALMISISVMCCVIAGFEHMQNTENMRIDYISPYVAENMFLGELIEGITLEQSFSTNLDTLEGVYLETATYARENTSDIKIIIASEEGDQIYEEVFALNAAIDNDFTYFEFTDDVNISEGKEWRLSVESCGNKGGNGICLVASTYDSYEAGELFVNGVKMEGDIFFYFQGCEYRSELPLIIYVIAAFFFSMLAHFWRHYSVMKHMYEKVRRICNAE